MVVAFSMMILGGAVVGMILVKRKRLISCSLLVGLLLIVSVAFCEDHDSQEHSDVFAHEDIQISTDQTIGRLIMASGSAVVAGVVTEGIIIVDGNVTIESGAMVNGRVVVLGGDIIIEEGAKLEKNPLVIKSHGLTLVPLVLGTLFLLSAASLILLPVVFWLIGHYFKKTSWYSPVKEQFLVVQRRWPALYIVIGLGISALMLTAFAALARQTIFSNTMERFDNTVIWLVRYFASPGVDRVMIFITDIGFGIKYLIIVVTTFLGLSYKKRWREVEVLAICLTGGALLNFWLKYVFHRTRPDLLHVVQEIGYSFPSGHVIASMCFYGMSAFLIMRTISSWRGRLTVLTLAVILNVTIGITRIYLGVHYPTDVVAGYAVGSMWVAFCISLLMWWERERV